MVSKRPILRQKVDKRVSDDKLCYFTLSNDIEPGEIVECLISSKNGSITTLYCRNEHEYSIRSVMKQLNLSSGDKIEIVKTKTIGNSFSKTIPFLGLTNIE